MMQSSMKALKHVTSRTSAFMNTKLNTNRSFSNSKPIPTTTIVAQFSSSTHQSPLREIANEAVYPKLPNFKFLSSSSSSSSSLPRTSMYIGGSFVQAPASSPEFQAVNPGNNQPLATVQHADQRIVQQAADAAKEAFAEGSRWRNMSPRERGNLLFKLAALIEEHKEDLAILESLNNGKTYQQALTIDVPATATMFRYYGGWCDKLNGLSIPFSSSHHCFTTHEPVGVCGLILPWNLPLIGCAAKLGPALATGCTVVLKPSELTPLTALALAELVERAGFPGGVVNVVTGDGARTGEHVTSAKQVDKLSFTGSVNVGKKVAMQAAKDVKRCTLELGGKNPIIVCADADLDLALKTVHNGLFWNKGEACAAGTRVFVHDDIYSAFVAGSVALASSRVVGHAFASSSASTVVEQGAQISDVHCRRILSYIEGAKQQGAKLETGGYRIGKTGNYVAPTVFSECTDDMTVFKEEVFGPVLTLSRFSSLPEVIARANNSEYGLAGGVFTRSLSAGHRVLKSLRVGMTFLNCYHVGDISAPFGGMKTSGIGREGGPYGLLPYMEVKSTTIAI